MFQHLACNQAESFNERHIHVANQIMTADRTLLDPKRLEEMAVLRMNDAWIQETAEQLKELLPLLSLADNTLHVE